MKKIPILFLFLFAICLSACKKDPVKTLEEKIIGKWNFDIYEVDSEPGTNGDGKYDLPQGAFVEFLPGSGTVNNLIFSDGGEPFFRTWTKINQNSFECIFVVNQNLIHKISLSEENKLVFYSEYYDEQSKLSYTFKSTLSRPFVPAAP